MKRRRFYRFFAICGFVLVGMVFVVARRAQLGHTIIPATRESGWLTPGQGYLIVAISLFFAVYSLIAFFRRTTSDCKSEPEQ